MNLKEFKFSQEPNFFSKNRKSSTKITDASVKNENIQTESLLTENLITEQYKCESESKTNITLDKSISESLNDFDNSYRREANLKLKDEMSNNDSIMIIKQDQQKNINETNNYRKRRTDPYMKRNETLYNNKVKKLFKKRDEDDKERGRCSRCEIL